MSDHLVQSTLRGVREAGLWTSLPLRSPPWWGMLSACQASRARLRRRNRPRNQDETGCEPQALSFALNAVLVAVGLLNAPFLEAQAAAPAKFEVASVKPCKAGPEAIPGGKSGGPGGRLRWAPARLDVECMTLDYLI